MHIFSLLIICLIMSWLMLKYKNCLQCGVMYKFILCLAFWADTKWQWCIYYLPEILQYFELQIRFWEKRNFFEVCSHEEKKWSENRIRNIMLCTIHLLGYTVTIGGHKVLHPFLILLYKLCYQSCSIYNALVMHRLCVYCPLELYHGFIREIWKCFQQLQENKFVQCLFLQNA